MKYLACNVMMSAGILIQDDPVRPPDTAVLQINRLPGEKRG